MWSRKSCLESAEIQSFVFLVLFNDWGRRVSPKFHLFVSDVDQGNRDGLGSKFSMRVADFWFILVGRVICGIKLFGNKTSKDWFTPVFCLY